jgi:hypothetical protein
MMWNGTGQGYRAIADLVLLIDQTTHAIFTLLAYSLLVLDVSSQMVVHRKCRINRITSRSVVSEYLNLANPRGCLPLSARPLSTVNTGYTYRTLLSILRG